MSTVTHLPPLRTPPQRLPSRPSGPGRPGRISADAAPPLAAAFLLLAAALAPAADRSVSDFNPYYPHRTYPKLITPQWVGEPGVECVVILAIDDMRGQEMGKVPAAHPASTSRK